MFPLSVSVSYQNNEILPFVITNTLLSRVLSQTQVRYKHTGRTVPLARLPMFNTINTPHFSIFFPADRLPCHPQTFLKTAQNHGSIITPDVNNVTVDGGEFSFGSVICFCKLSNFHLICVQCE